MYVKQCGNSRRKVECKIRAINVADFTRLTFRKSIAKRRIAILDEGIAEIVYGLWERGVKTSTSCDGNHPGAINERRVSFGWDDELAGRPGIAAALAADMLVYQLRKCYPGSTTEDYAEGRFFWELVFDRHQDWSRKDGRAERR